MAKAKDVVAGKVDAILPGIDGKILIARLEAQKVFPPGFGEGRFDLGGAVRPWRKDRR